MQEAKVKLNRIDKAVKSLQRECEVEEGEHRSMGELVLELREVGEYVHVVEFFQREVEQLEEKIAELEGKVREGRAGARSLEEVGREAKDVSRKLQSARANLTNCKETLETLETVLGQSLLINKLEAGHNRLTQDKWRLRGSSRGGPKPKPRGRSWKTGC